jgi:hypothetical protein
MGFTHDPELPTELKLPNACRCRERASCQMGE